MRTVLIVVASILLLVSCGKDNPTNPAPQNNAPVITTVGATPNPVPKNRIVALTVTATDADSTELSYEWSATAGAFANGSTTAQVTWVPPSTETGYTVSVTVSDGEADDDTSIVVNVTKAVFGLSGQVRNQSGEAADGVTMFFTDSDDEIHTITSGSDGGYELVDLPEGSVTIEMTTSDIIVHVLPRYLDKDTTISLTQNSVVNLGIREFHRIFYDDGTDFSQWSMHGGVQNDGAKYIFEDYFLQYDYMSMVVPTPVPANADLQNSGFLVLGESAPSGNSRLWGSIAVNGSPISGYWEMVYGNSQTWYWGSLEQINSMPGSNIQMTFEFEEIAAAYIYVRQIWIYNY